MKRRAIARAAGIRAAALIITVPAAATALPKGPPSALNGSMQSTWVPPAVTKIG